MQNPSLIAFVLRAKNRIKIMQILKDNPKISSDIERETKMYKSHVSRALKELQKKRFIKCVNPNDRNFRFYKLTNTSKKVLLEVERILKHTK